MNYIFIILTVLWLLEFFIFPSLKKEERTGKNSFSIILVSILSIIIVNALMYSMNFLIIKSFFLKVIALLIYGLGLILRYWSLILLGKNFSRDVEVETDQELISRGTYRYIRHPLYLGLFLLTVSVPLFVGNIPVFLLAIAVMFRAIRIRIVEEESFMEDVLGQRYITWKDERYKFLPFIY